ncbi:MAG TPA: hypothetical protein VGA84_01000 [Thermoanaerobaculia bacterium]
MYWVIAQSAGKSRFHTGGDVDGVAVVVGLAVGLDHAHGTAVHPDANRQGSSGRRDRVVPQASLNGDGAEDCLRGVVEGRHERVTDCLHFESVLLREQRADPFIVRIAARLAVALVPSSPCSATMASRSAVEPTMSVKITVTVPLGESVRADVLSIVTLGVTRGGVSLPKPRWIFERSRFRVETAASAMRQSQELTHG